MTSKPEYIHSKFTSKKITKCEGVIDYKIIREIHRKIKANTSTIQSELGGVHHGLLRMAIPPATYQTIIGHDFQHPARPPQASTLKSNVDAAEVTRYIQHHVAQVYQWRQTVNAEDILEQQLLESMDEQYFNG